MYLKFFAYIVEIVCIIVDFGIIHLILLYFIILIFRYYLLFKMIELDILS